MGKSIIETFEIEAEISLNAAPTEDLLAEAKALITQKVWHDFPGFSVNICELTLTDTISFEGEARVGFLDSFRNTIRIIFDDAPGQINIKSGREIIESIRF